MKSLFSLFLAWAVTATSWAQIVDAFKGIYPVTDRTQMKSLNGEWQLKVVKGINDEKTVPQTDGTWGKIPVPGCWEAYGFCEPKYNYPDSLTGYYRTEFTVPQEWKGQQVIIRMDGVLRGYDLWLNDKYVGTWESGYNTCLFDLTPYLTKRAFKGEPQQLAMRVYSKFKGYEFDCFDDWTPMGIFRDVTLFNVPKTHLSDFSVVTTAIDGGKARVRFDSAVANPDKNTGVVVYVNTPQGDLLYDSDYTPHALDKDGRLTIEIEDDEAYLWTAETPWLYRVGFAVCEKGKYIQSFELKFGIRQISIDRNVLKLNGQPIKLRGVNAHSTDPWTVKVISDELTLKDMKMMKEASVNYMRLSHYPREPRFFELADSMGFYLVDEVPFGFGDKHLSSRSYQDILKTRALATVMRDKNHPSVLVWSVGNENPLPQTCIEVGDYVGSLDSSRPYCFPQVGSYFRKFWEKAGVEPSETGESPFPSKAPVYAPHYPTTGQIGGFYQHLDRPVIFTEYCHTLGISFEDHDRQWEIIERTPGIAGGSVWEWADQGMPFGSPNLTSPIMGRNLTPLSSGRGAGGEAFSKWRTDGSERDQMVFTTEDGGFEMKGNFGTDGLLYADRTPLPNYYELQHNYARAFVSIDNSLPLTAYRLPFNCQCTNRYDFLNLKDNVTFHWYLTVDCDTVVRGAFSPDVAPHTTAPYALSIPQVTIPEKSLVMLQFDIEDVQGYMFLHQSFVLQKSNKEWKGVGNPTEMIQQGALVRTGRKATMAERITQKGRLIERYLLPLDNKQVKAEVKTEPIDGGQSVSFTILPDTADVFRAELGLAYLLDKSIDRVQWIGKGPFAAYPGRQQACRYGIWAKQMDDLYFEGNHAGVDAALFCDKDGNGLLVTGDSLNINFEQTDRGIVMTVNAAVSGQGPKFAKTAFNAWKPEKGAVGGSFRIYKVDAAHQPWFSRPQAVPEPFHPFLTQYDTYLLKFDDIIEK